MPEKVHRSGAPTTSALATTTGGFTPWDPTRRRELEIVEREWHAKANPLTDFFFEQYSRARVIAALERHAVVHFSAHASEDAHPEDEDESVAGSLPVRTWSISIASLGDERYRLRYPIVIMLEDYQSEIIASWPDVEAWGSGATDVDAINALKDDLVRLCEELFVAQPEELGKLPRRWALSLLAVVEILQK